jgi:transposase
MASCYSREFKEEAVRLVVHSGKSLPQIAADLGVNNWTLRDWVRAYRAQVAREAPPRPETLEEENRRLKRENSILRQERDILKKAAAYFAKEQL